MNLNPFKKDDPGLPEVENFDYKEDCEYVMVLPSQKAGYLKQGFKEVAVNITQHDGQMSVLERKRV